MALEDLPTNVISGEGFSDMGRGIADVLNNIWDYVPVDLLLTVGIIATLFIIGIGVFLYIQNSKVYWPRALGMSALIAGSITGIWLGSGFVMSLFYGSLAFSFYWASWENTLPGIVAIGIFVGFFIEHAYFEGEREAGQHV